MAWKPPGKKKLANRVVGGLPAQGKTGGLNAPPVKNTKVGRSVLNDQMPGKRGGLHKEIVNAIEQPIRWSKPKVNTVAGNPRKDAEYRVGVDPKTGDKLHYYQEGPGGLPAEVVRVKKKLSKKLM